MNTIGTKDTDGNDVSFYVTNGSTAAALLCFVLLMPAFAHAAWGVPKLGASLTVDSGDAALAEPAGVAEGDLMVACIGYRSNVAFGLPAGWALVNTQQSSGDTDATNGIASGVMAYIVRGASAPALTFTRTGGNQAVGRIVSYSGGQSTPLDTGTSNTLIVASATATTSSITTAEAGELIVACLSPGDTYNASAFDAATDPTTASGATDTTTAPTNGTWLERTDVSYGGGTVGWRWRTLSGQLLEQLA